MRAGDEIAWKGARTSGDVLDGFHDEEAITCSAGTTIAYSKPLSAYEMRGAATKSGLYQLAPKTGGGRHGNWRAVTFDP